jgi:hypothetical protein
MSELFVKVVELKHSENNNMCPLDGNCVCNGYEDANQCNPDDG